MFSFTSSEILDHRVAGNFSTRRYSKGSIKKMRLPPGDFGFFVPLNHQEERGVHLLDEVIDSDYQG